MTHKYADYLEYDYKINLHEGEMYVKQSLSAQKYRPKLKVRIILVLLALFGYATKVFGICI